MLLAKLFPGSYHHRQKFPPGIYHHPSRKGKLLIASPWTVPFCCWKPVSPFLPEGEETMKVLLNRYIGLVTITPNLLLNYFSGVRGFTAKIYWDYIFFFLLVQFSDTCSTKKIYKAHFACKLHFWAFSIRMVIIITFGSHFKWLVISA